MIFDNPKAYPIFLTKNYFNGDAAANGGTFTTTSMGGLGARLYDMDPFAYGLSAGSIEGVAEVVVSQLYEGTAIANRIVHLIALLNNNLASFIVYGSSDGGVTFPTTLATVVGNTDPNWKLDLSGAPVTINAVKISATNVMAPLVSQEKQIGTIVLCGFLGQVSRAPDKIDRVYYDSQRVVQLADKSEDVTYIKRSPASHEFYGCDITFTFLSDADRDMLRTIRRTSPAFCLMPEPGERPGDIFYGRFNGDWKDSQTMLYKLQGNSTVISFKETTS